MVNPRLLIRRVQVQVFREEALDLAHDALGVVFRTDEANGDVIGIATVAKPSIARVRGVSYRHRLSRRIQLLSVAFQRPDLGRFRFTLCPFPADVSSEGADFLGIRAVGRIRRPALSPVIGSLHRFHTLIQFLEDDVGKDGGANPALWRSAVGVVEHPILHIACFQHGLDEVDEPTIINYTLQQGDQHRMINPVIEALDVEIHQPDDAGPGALHVAQRRMAGPLGSEPMRRVGEDRLIDALQQGAHHFLDQLVVPRRHAEWS
jgi:hypothetical protein